MAANDKQATLEPIQFDDKSVLAIFCQFLGIIIWCIGAVGVVFAVLAYLGIGSFYEMFAMIMPDGLSIPAIVGMGAAVLLAGLPLLIASEILKLLKRNATTIYAIRGLDSMIPKTVSVDGLSMEALSGIGRVNPSDAESQSEEESGTRTTVKKDGDGASIQITVNVGGQGAASPDQAPVSIITGSDQKPCEAASVRPTPEKPQEEVMEPGGPEVQESVVNTAGGADVADTDA